jgi:hypothetical protein
MLPLRVMITLRITLFNIYQCVYTDIYINLIRMEVATKNFN